ncbi:hypothetical protein LSTR_LSTR012732 [Laodelphax striatellus]|uniref:Uncharacterized protein n=1 Tax=Laodelphax striatellus TaxID=195883 RepID=A0A482WMX1_LAOST|nr:hypothetical protein LSTR_LSTR012732 [Laodelphax striatellus]
MRWLLFGLLILIDFYCLSVLATVSPIIDQSHLKIRESNSFNRISLNDRESCCSFEDLINGPSSAKLDRLRSIMTERNVSAYIVTNSDDHQSEYLATADRRLEFLTGFTGSNAVAVVTLKKAALWTDSRYHLQADNQLDCNWLLMKDGNDGIPTIEQWLAVELKPLDNVSADPRVISAGRWKRWSSYLAHYQINMLGITDNLVDVIWEDKPARSNSSLLIHDIRFAGESWQSKLSRIRGIMSSLYIDTLIVTALDEIAWALNLRGDDVPYTPVFRSYLIINNASATLYLPFERITPELRTHLYSNDDVVLVVPYERVWYDLALRTKLSYRVWLPSSMGSAKGVSYLIYLLVPEEKAYYAPSPIINLRAIKNNVEAQGMQNAHIRDAIAICYLWALMEEGLPIGERWDELKVAKVLERLRLQQDYNRGPSFDSIIAFGSNAALPHYIPTPSTSRKIDNSNVLMIDSGGQYLDGTIDTTRTIHFGTPTEFQKMVYTALLKGCIDMASIHFPRGSTYQQLDVIIRRPLYELGFDYGHGSGHGVGFHLAVHEGFNYTYDVNFFGTHEPGYYQANEFGMRLENIVQVVEVQNQLPNQEKSFLTFKPITLVPYETKLIDFKQMEKHQIRWLNAYNKRIRDEVGEEMIRQGRHKLYKWLVQKTDPVCSD